MQKEEEGSNQALEEKPTEIFYPCRRGNHKICVGFVTRLKAVINCQCPCHVVPTIPLYKAIARQFERYKRSTTEEIEYDAEEQIETLVRNHLPHGSGFDSGFVFDFDESTLEPSECLKLTFAYHHMNENGYYCGWSYWTLTITPSLAMGYNFEIKADSDLTLIDDEDLDPDGFKEYADDTIAHCLDTQVPEYSVKKKEEGQ